MCFTLSFTIIVRLHIIVQVPCAADRGDCKDLFWGTFTISIATIAAVP